MKHRRNVELLPFKHIAGLDRKLAISSPRASTFSKPGKAVLDDRGQLLVLLGDLWLALGREGGLPRSPHQMGRSRQSIILTLSGYEWESHKEICEELLGTKQAHGSPREQEGQEA